MSNRPQCRRRSLLEPLESRQHMAADLIVTALTVDQSLNPVRTGADHRISGTVTVKNIGSSVATGSALVFIYVESEPRVTTDTLRWSIDNNNTAGNLGAGQSTTFHFSGTLPQQQWDLDDNTTYLAAWVNSNHGVVESNEDNNRYRAEGTDYYALRYDDNLVALPTSGNPVNAWPLAAGTTYQGMIGDEVARGADMDTYAIDLPGGQTWELGVVGANGFDTNLRVYDVNWNLVASSDQHPETTSPNDPFVHIAVGMQTRYYLVVANNFNANADPRSLQGRSVGQTGTYTIYTSTYTWPTVSITPGDSNVVTEGSSGGFWLNRSGRTDRAITVKWDVLGSAIPDADVKIGDGSASNLTSYTIPIGQSKVWVPVQALADSDTTEGTEYIYFDVRYKDEYVTGSPSTIAIYVQEDPTKVGPRLLTPGFMFDDRFGKRLYFQFDTAIAGVDADDITIQNLTTGQTFADRRTIASPNGDAALVFFDHGLPDGNYRATIRAGAVTNPQGTPNAQATFDFFLLNGDANHDRKVDFTDLLTLAKNYGRTDDRTWSSGDFDNDGAVAFSDLLLLAKHYGQSIATPPAATPLGSEVDQASSELPTRRRNASAVLP